jgi:hypothetical protein
MLNVTVVGCTGKTNITYSTLIVPAVCTVPTMVLAPTAATDTVSASAFGYYLNASYSFTNSSITAFITNVMLNMTAYSPVAL